MKRKAIWLAQDHDTALKRVFDEQTTARLEALVDLHPTPVNEGNIGANRDSLQDVEIAFSTWGIPKLTQEQIRQYLPT